MLAFVSIFTVSCDNDDDNVVYVDNDTYAGVIEITRSFQYNSAGNFGEQHVIRQVIGQYGMQESDKVLVYRLKGVYQGADVWEQTPKTIYFLNGNEVDYDFDFTKNDVQIYVNGNYDVTTTPAYYNNQTFRIVLVPAGYLNKGTSPVDYSDYNAVIKYFNIDDSKVVKIK
ncbi:hypothetical protein [Chryseobacterium turcicum]|uniref:Uncharacterized protein n=1 Tax=Chryseobacterium turcicum TaxID=2898076 RepID=A0A9Q3YXC3_9FLAO|nr:hypothetical protein [Chryseobacterium turcicum]MCD1118814.1 hypothetical protein [Chryseobacterium turcicum]